MAIRAALGAGRARLIRQLLTESVLLAASGGALGLLIGLWAVDAMKQLIPPSLPNDIHLDSRVLLFVVVISVASVLFFGLLPALLASRPDLSTASQIYCVSRASRKVGLASLPLSIPWRKSATWWTKLCS